MTAVESNSGHSAVLHCPTANLARPPKPFVQLPRPCFQLWRARHVVVSHRRQLARRLVIAAYRTARMNVASVFPRLTGR
jgi:hypothetical protein